jgi:hypothetical protein
VTNGDIKHLSNVKAKPDRDYDMLVAVNGVNVTVVVDGQEFFSYTYEPRVINGYAYGLNSGWVGFGCDNSRGNFDNIEVKVLPPEITFEGTEEFPDTDPDIAFAPASGTWSDNAGRYEGAAESGAAALSLVDLGLDSGLEVSSLLQIGLVQGSADLAGVVFDYYGPTNFKFAGISAENDQAIIGHYTENSGWVNDAIFDMAVDAGQDFYIEVVLHGTTVSLSVREQGQDQWQAIVGHVFNAVVVDGEFGLFTHADTSSVDEVMVKTDDPAFRDEGDNLLAVEAPLEPVAGEALIEAQLVPIVEEATSRWIESEFVDRNGLAVLATVSFEVADLEGLALGHTSGTSITIDVSAAGHGWFVDATPYYDEEFHQNDSGDLVLEAIKDSEAAGRMDLLTVVMHELGHVLGFDHTEAEGLMDETLEVGVRCLLEEPALPRPVIALAPSDFNNSAYRSFLRLFDSNSDRGVPIWFFQHPRQNALGFNLGKNERSKYLIL